MYIAALVAAVIVFGFPSSTHAQLKGHYPPGFTGMNNGTQAPPSLTVLFPFYFYPTDTIKNDNGQSLGVHPKITASFFSPGLAWVTNFKLFGGNYGGQVLPLPYYKSRIEGTSLDVPGDWRFSDIYVVPFQLGWSKPRADFLVGWGFFAPSGHWELGADDNGGLGMVSNEFQAGTTVRLDNKREWTVSVLGTYEINGDKMNGGITSTHIQVGNIMILEGGFGRSFYRKVSGTPLPFTVTLGIPYYAQFKVTADNVPVPGLSAFVSSHKDHVFAVGAEGSVFIPQAKLLLGLRFVPEFGAVNRTQGHTWMFTSGYRFKSLVKAPGAKP